MSTKIAEETDKLPSFTVFYGGTNRGFVLQLTKNEQSHGTQFITIDIDYVQQFIQRLQITHARYFQFNKGVMMKIKDIEVGKMFTIDESPSYPKLRTENGYVDLRDDIVRDGYVLEWNNVREIGIEEVAKTMKTTNEVVSNILSEAILKYIGKK